MHLYRVWNCWIYVIMPRYTASVHQPALLVNLQQINWMVSWSNGLLIDRRARSSGLKSMFRIRNMFFYGSSDPCLQVPSTESSYMYSSKFLRFECGRRSFASEILSRWWIKLPDRNNPLLSYTVGRKKNVKLSSESWLILQFYFEIFCRNLT